MPPLRIHPLHVGTITRPVSQFCYKQDPGKLIEVPLLCWYIEGSNHRILVDTGGTDPSNSHPSVQPYKREEDQSVGSALKKIGLSCQDIEIVIITHLHWDHCSGIELFPEAKILIQKEEIETARNPFPVFSKRVPRSVIHDVNYTVLSGDQEIAEGVKVILLPGHSYGLQGVLVEAETRRILIAGDTIPLFRNLEFTPPMIGSTFVGLREYYGSLEKIASLSAFILPGHDLKVLEQKTYS